MQLSLVIPLLNEAESLPELHQWLVEEVTPMQLEYEILFIDDGSTDTSWEVITALCRQHPKTKGIRFLKNFGEISSPACWFCTCKGRGRNYLGCRFTRLTKRNSQPIPTPLKRKFGYPFWVEKETL